MSRSGVVLALALTITMVFVIADKMLAFLPGGFQWFSFAYHSGPMTRGVVDLRNVVFFLSVTALCLGVTHIALERRRWS